MKLAEYMELRNLKDSALATDLGVNRATVTKLRLGKTMPSMRLAVLIAQISKGAVTANDFLSPPSGPPSEPERLAS